MKKRIFWSICLASLITLILTTLFIVSVMYNNSTDELIKEVKAENLYIGNALDSFGNDSNSIDEYIKSVGKDSVNRITLISSDGTVLYDNFADAEIMDNHLSRPEIKKAIETGIGDSTRTSDTIGEKTYYYAEKIDNGNILRVACTTKSVVGIMGNAFFWIILISIFVLFIAVIIASLITNLIVKPINKLDLYHPLSNNTYEELSPLLNRMEKQNIQLSKQLDTLTDRQKEFETITENMNEGLILFGKKGVVLFENKSAKSTLGNEIGKSYLHLCRDTEFIRSVETALRGEPSISKISLKGRIYQLSATSVREDINAYAAVLFIVDVTDKEQAEKLRREFSANVSHELKTPLTTIMGCAEIMENGIVKKEDIPHFSKQIYSEASRLLSLIDDIIKLSRLDEADLKAEFVPVDLAEISRNVILQLSEKAKNMEVNLSFEGEKAEISGYMPILHEMIYNLCDNAITYNKKGGSVVVTISRKEGRIYFSVSDTGVGIAPEHQQRVFERFYRVDKSHSKDTGGTGLGLSIVKHAAILHNATITLESRINFGTSITVIF